MMKNAFYLPHELSSFSRYLDFCLGFLVTFEKQPDEKDQVNFKIYDVTNWKQTIAMFILLPNISRSKGNRQLNMVS